jgi:hypothetical protein
MHGFEHYGIIDIAAANAVDYSQVGETSADTIRRSLDGFKFVLKWVQEPTFIKDGTITPLQVLTHEECLALMQTPEWSEIIEE